MKNFLKGFGLGFCLLIFFILGLISTKAYELLVSSDKSKIVRKIEASKNIAYDTYVSFPRFSASKLLSTKENLSEEEKAKITKIFEDVLNRVKVSNICTGGSYMLQPNIAYKDGLSVPSGFRFDAGFECNFKKDEISKYQELLKDINKILENNEFISLNIPAIKSSISDEMLNKVREELHDDLYKKSSELAQHYSQITNKLCVISDINYENDPYSQRVYKADIAYNVPIENDANEKLYANTTFECR